MALEPRPRQALGDLPGVFALWIILAALFVACAVVSFTVTTEDAYISFRYAENIAGGYGLVFNRGEGAVEGYSNPTWVFLLTITDIMRLNTVNAARCLGLFFGALTLLELILLFRTLGEDRTVLGMMAALAVATAPCYLFWSQTGLENGLFIYLLVLGLRLAVQEEKNPQRFPFSAIAYLLLAVTRPEGIMYFVIIGAWKLVRSRSEKQGKTSGRFLLWAGLVIALFIAFLLWRYSVFHEWVPNTFFAKVNNGLRWNLRVGARYLIGFLNHSLWSPVILPTLAALWSRRFPASDLGRRLLWAVVLQASTLVLFVLYVGGDIHPNDRFGVPLIVFASISAFVLLSGLPDQGLRWWKSPVFWVTILFILANLGYSFPPAYGIEPPIGRPPNFLTANLAGLVAGRINPNDILSRFADPPVDALEFVGRDLAAEPGLDGLIAAEQCGKIPYFYGRPVLDLLGLNDPKIAHIVHSVGTWDLYANEILSHSPEAFVMVYRGGHFISRYYIENTVLSEPFRRRYRLDAIYHVEYYFRDIAGVEHKFDFELVRYRPVSEDALTPLTDEEIRWFSEHNPSVETPDALAEEVEAFRRLNEQDEEKVIRFRVDLN